MSNARLFCIGFAVAVVLFAVSYDLDWLTSLAKADYWTAKLVGALFGGSFIVVAFGDRPKPPTPGAN